MTKNERLKLAREKKGMSQPELAAAIDAGQSYIAGLESDKGFSYKKAIKLAEVLGVTADWLYFGDESVKQPEKSNVVEISNTPKEFESKKGNPKHLTSVKRHENARPISDQYFEYTSERFVQISPGRYRMTVKLVDQRAKAGYPAGFIDPEYIENLRDHAVTVNQFHRGNYKAFEIDGDSMDDGTINCIPDGTIVTCREIPYDAWRSKLHTHKWPNFVFVHRDLGVMSKQISYQDVDNGIITLHSLNPDKAKYPDFEVEMDDLFQIFNVVKRELQG